MYIMFYSSVIIMSFCIQVKWQSLQIVWYFIILSGHSTMIYYLHFKCSELNLNYVILDIVQWCQILSILLPPFQ